MIARVMPSVTVHQVLWELPWPLVGYYAVQAARAAGVKGICRPEESDNLWKRFSEAQKRNGKKKDDVSRGRT